MIYQNIKKCRICNSKNLKKILDLKKQPSSNSLRRNIRDKEYKIPLVLLFCNDCSTVQLSSTANPKYLFDHYVWVTKTSKSAKDYSNLFCDRILKKTKKNSFIVEIASNDGTFLKPFIIKKRKVLGVDPAKNIARMANKDGVKTLPEFFNINCAKKIIKSHDKADIVFARNVIPHVKDIHSIIEGMSALLSENGTAVIEFHYSKIIQDELHYDSIYHEHLFYFTITTITNLLKKYGLNAYDVDKSPISGGSLVLYFSKENIKPNKKLIAMLNLEKTKKVNSYLSWIKFAKQSTKHALKFKETLKKLKTKYDLIGYGASARSSTLLNFSGIDNSIISKIIDKNKLKRNKFTPGSGIKILDYENIIEKISNYNLVVILAWNFKNEIINDLKKNGYKGKFLVPLPNKIVFK